MNKIYKVEFEYKGQQINYYNKLKLSDSVVYARMYTTAESKKIVEFSYK